jgi:hypothetical protein
MEYFLLSQDDRIVGAVKPLGLSQLVKDHGLVTESWDNLTNLPAQFYLENSNPEYIDFIAKPVPIISNRLKQLFQIFDPKIFFKPVALANPKAIHQELYWLINPPSCDCIAAKSEFNKNGTIKRLAIDCSKTDERWIFKVARITECLIVINLGVAECMLRREFNGIQLIRIDTILKNGEI